MTTRTTPPASSSPADGAPEEKRRPWSIALVLLVFVGLALVVVVARTSFHRGDYLMGVRPEYMMAARLDPLPVLTVQTGPGRPATSGPRTFFVAGLGRKVHVFAPGARRGHWPAGVIPDLIQRFWFRMGSIEPDPSEPGVRRVTWGAMHRLETRAEAFPAGALEPVFRAFAASDWEALVDEAERLHRRMPENLTVRYWIVSGLAMSGDFDAARARLDAWEADFLAGAGGRGAILVASARGDLAMLSRADHAARHAAWQRHFLTTSMSPAAMPSMEESFAYLRTLRDVSPARMPTFTAEVPNFLHYQITSKLAIIEAVFAAIRGERDAADALLLGLLSLSVPEEAPSTLITALVDVVVHQLATRALIAMHLEGSETAARLEATWRVVDDVRMRRQGAVGHVAVALAFDPFGESANIAEAMSREQVAAAWFELYRAGVQVRHHRLATGAWPEAPAGGDPGAMFGQLALPTTAPPRDPFASATGGGPFQWRAEPDRFVLWSVGPDEWSDGGSVAYDPTNGTISPGDLIVEIPAAARHDYPFEAGYRYDGHADFDARYPHGLPIDPFTRGEPLRLSRDGLDRVWSFGPDADHRGGGPATFVGRAFQDAYDPTNGTTSAGDVWMVLPRRDAGAP